MREAETKKKGSETLLISKKRGKRNYAAQFRSGNSVLLLAAATGLLMELFFAPPVSAQERAWVRDEIRINLRSGPDIKFRILRVVVTGDGVSILHRGEGWTQVRLDDATEGWIPEGYLRPNPPASIRVVQQDAEVSRLQTQLATTTEQADQLRTANTSLTESDGLQRSEIDRLILENTKLRAGARYPELIAGASILAAGMILGAMLHKSSSSRRPASRIRL